MTETWRIEGRVQGVGYRQWMVRQAVAAGVRGWVRNRRDGSVEAVVEGDRVGLDRLHDRCHAGPPAAAVTRIVRQSSGTLVDLDGFRQIASS